jgi:hypothetical protein
LPFPPRPQTKGIIEALSKLRGAVQKEQKEEKDIAEKARRGGGGVSLRR